MRGLSKKMLISILTSVVVFVTMIATTFAWVGIFTYASTDSFQMNLRVTKNANDFLTISSSGKRGTFSDEVNISDIQKDILKNMNKWSTLDEYEYNNLSNIDLKGKYIQDKYNKNCIVTPSSCIIKDNKLSNFYSINNKNLDYYETYESTNSYLKFDLFLSVDTKEGIQDTTEINSNVFMVDLENTLEGTISKQRFTNLNPYKNLPSIPNEYSILKSLPDTEYFNINSANAVRFALCLYNPIALDDSYDESYSPQKILIYQGGKQNPNEDFGVYDLGGNLPEDYNTALKELLIIRPNYKNSIYNDYNMKYENDLQKAIERGQNDLELVEANSRIWTKNNNYDEPYLGVHNGIQTKMKIIVYFWFEGWDSDCINGINQMPVNLNLTFTAGIEE